MSSIETITGSFQPSSGNLYGNIYTLDGKPMLKRFDLNTGEDITGKRTNQTKGILYCATEPYFAPIIGHSFLGDKPTDLEETRMLAEDGAKRILQPILCIAMLMRYVVTQSLRPSYHQRRRRLSTSYVTISGSCQCRWCSACECGFGGAKGISEQ